jgi:transposase InsO family protein
MPWKESDAVSERMKFISRILEGERMTDLCREYGISRKTGYKIFARYEREGLSGLEDQSRAARHRPNETPGAIARAIVDLRNEHPTWGAPKIQERLKRLHSRWSIPAISTIHAILDRHQLVKRTKGRANSARATGTDLHAVKRPNDLWCTDFKGQFKMGNAQLCYPLTITDQYSRYLLACEGMEAIDEQACIEEFERVFEEVGVPSAIRSDNGVPFASSSFFGLSRLSVWWIRLGIRLERIKPGCPEQNGCHERMHRTLKAEATKPASQNLLSQQERFDAFRQVFNNERPHQALKMKCPQELYKPSRRAFKQILEPLEYPSNYQTYKVTRCGRITLSPHKRLYVGTPFAGENIGIVEKEDGVWKATFINHDLGFFEWDNPELQVSVNPFLIKTDQPTKKV